MKNRFLMITIVLASFAGQAAAKPQTAARAQAAVSKLKPKFDAHLETAQSLHAACELVASSQKHREEFDRDLKVLQEKFDEVKSIEKVFDSLRNCHEKSKETHEAMMRTEANVRKMDQDSDVQIQWIAYAADTCKTRERAQELRKRYDQMAERTETLVKTANESSELHQSQLALSTELTKAKSLPPRVDPHLADFREHLNWTLGAQKILRKQMTDLLTLEKKYEGERVALETKYQELQKAFETVEGVEAVLAPLDAAQSAREHCDKQDAMDFIAELDKSATETEGWIAHIHQIKPVFASILTCKPMIDDAALENIKASPRKLSASVDQVRGAIDVKRCLATASFYDEVTKNLEDKKDALKSTQAMKVKELENARRASAVPTLRKEKEASRSKE